MLSPLRAEVGREEFDLAELARFAMPGLRWVTLAQRASAVLVSRLLLGHCFGALPAPGGDLLFCFDCIALRVTVSARNLVRKGRRKDFSGASVNAELRPWEPGPSLGFAGCDPSRFGKFNKRRQDHVPEQSQPHRIPRR